MLSFQVASGGQHWFISGCFLDPEDAVTIKRVVGAISKRPRRAVMLVARELKTNLAAP